MCASIPVKNNSRLISEDRESGRIALTLSWMRGRRNRAPSWGEGRSGSFGWSWTPVHVSCLTGGREIRCAVAIVLNKSLRKYLQI